LLLQETIKVAAIATINSLFIAVQILIL